MCKSTKRAARRARTRAIALERRRLRLEFHRREDRGNAARVPEFGPTHFAKWVPFGCGCRKHPRGRPRVPTLLCKLGVRARIYLWRRLARENALAIIHGKLAPDDDAVGLVPRPPW